MCGDWARAHIARAVAGPQFLDKTHYLSMEVPLASSAGMCWLLAAALSLCDTWSTPPPRTGQWRFDIALPSAREHLPA